MEAEELGFVGIEREGDGRRRRRSCSICSIRASLHVALMERVEDDETELLDTEAAQGEVHGDGEGVAADGGMLWMPVAADTGAPIHDAVRIRRIESRLRHGGAHGARMVLVDLAAVGNLDRRLHHR